MNRNFAKALSLVLKHEGGFVDHPADPGGATNKGVTIGTYRAYIDPQGTVDDLKHITDAQLAKVYREQYWNKVRGDDLPDGVDYAVFDFAVNSGPSRAAKFLQTVVSSPADGVVGPKTIEATRRAKPPTEVIRILNANRMEFLQGLPTWKTFGKGWTTRVKDVGVEASAMARQAPVTIPAPDIPPTPSKPVPVPPAAGKNWLVLLVEFIVGLFRKK